MPNARAGRRPWGAGAPIRKFTSWLRKVPLWWLLLGMLANLPLYHYRLGRVQTGPQLTVPDKSVWAEEVSRGALQDPGTAGNNATLNVNQQTIPPSTSLLALMLRPASATPLYPQHMLLQYYVLCIHWVEFMLLSGVDSIHWVDMSPQPDAFLAEEDIFRWYTARSMISHSRILQSSEPQKRNLGIMRTAAIILSEVRPQWVVLCHRPGDLPWVPGGYGTPMAGRRQEENDTAASLPLWNLLITGKGAGLHTRDAVSSPVFNPACMLELNMTLRANSSHQSQLLDPPPVEEAPGDPARLQLRAYRSPQEQPKGLQLPGLMRLSFFTPEGSTVDRIFMALHVLGVEAILGLRKRTQVTAELHRDASRGLVKPLLSVGLEASSVNTLWPSRPGNETSAHGGQERGSQWPRRAASSSGRQRRSLLQHAPHGMRDGDSPMVFVALLEAAEWHKLGNTTSGAQTEWELVQLLLRSDTESLEALVHALQEPFAAAKQNVRRLLLKAAVDTLNKGLEGLETYRTRLLEQTKAKAEARFLFLSSNPNSSTKGQIPKWGWENVPKAGSRGPPRGRLNHNPTGSTWATNFARGVRSAISRAQAGGGRALGGPAGPGSGQRRLLVTAEELKSWHRKHTRHKQRLQEQREEELRAAQRQGQEAGSGLVQDDSAREQGNASAESVVKEYGSQSQFLAAMVFNRVYDEDAFHMTSFQLMQWIEYHLYAGVDRIFWYDMAREDYESQESALRPYVEAGQVVYSRFHQGHTLNVDIDFEQRGAILDFLRVTKGEFTWALLCDVDEYVFMPRDTKRGFLPRLLKRQRPSVSQLVLRNMFFLAPPVPLPGGALLIERYRHRNASATEPPRRTKPILRLDRVGPYSGNPHRFSMDKGTSLTQHPGVVRLNHYWGLRLHGFGPMPREEWAQCKEDYSIQPLVDVVKRQLSWQASWSPAFELQKTTWLLRQGLQILRQARQEQEHFLTSSPVRHVTPQAETGAVGTGENSMGAASAAQALSQPLVLKFSDALQSRNSRADVAGREGQTVPRSSLRLRSKEGGGEALQDMLVLMLRIPEREEWGQEKTPQELSAYYTQCLEWIELSVHSGVKAVWWIDFSPAPSAGPPEEDVFAEYVASSHLVYQRHEFKQYMKELYTIVHAVATVISKVQPRFILLCHRPSDFFLLNQDSLQALAPLALPQEQTAHSLLHSQEGGAPSRRAETARQQLHSQRWAASQSEAGSQALLRPAQRGLLQVQEQGEVVQGREGGQKSSLSFQVDPHLLVSAWEGLQDRLTQRGQVEARQAGAPPPPPVSALSSEEREGVDPSVAAALAAAAELRVKRVNTCKIVQVDVPTIIVQQRGCNSTQRAAFLDCLTSDLEVGTGTGYLVRNPLFRTKGKTPRESQKGTDNPPLLQHPPLSQPPLVPPPPQEPLCSPLGPVPSLLAASYLSSSLRLQDVEAALSGLGKEALFGCQDRFEPRGAGSETRSLTERTGGRSREGGSDKEGASERQGSSELGARERDGSSEGFQAEEVHRWLQQGFLLSVQDMARGRLSSAAVSKSASAGTSSSKEGRGGQDLDAPGGARPLSPSAVGAGFLSHGPLWAAAGKKVRESRTDLQARAVAARDGIRAFQRCRQYLLALDSGRRVLRSGLQDLQDYFSRILSRSKAADEGQFLRLCNEPRAQLDGTLALDLDGPLDLSRSLKRRILSTDTTPGEGTPQEDPASLSQTRAKGRDRDRDRGRGAFASSGGSKSGKALRGSEVRRERDQSARHGQEGHRQEGEPRAPRAESGGSPGNSSARSGLVAVVFNRIYREDGFNMTAYELWQWIEYYLYGGVEKVYWYDMARTDAESQRGALQQYWARGQVHYMRFHAVYPPNFDIHYEQDNAVRHFLRTFGGLHRYAVFVDVDEYMFTPQDTQPGFLGRLVGSVFASGHYAEVLVKNVFFPAPPLPLAPGALLVECYQHRNRTPEPGTSRAKALVDLRCVKGIFPGQPHALPLRCGHTLEADPSLVRLNHYWGLRTKGYAPLQPGEWRTYVHDTSILPIARVIRRRLEWLYGQLPAFQIERPFVNIKGALEFLQFAQNALLRDLL